MRPFEKLFVMIFVIVIATALVVFCMRAAVAEDLIGYVISSDTYVNVRETPSTKGKIGGRLDFGWEATIIDRAKDNSGTLWYKIDGVTEMGYGWVCANYMIFDKPERVEYTAKVNSNGRVAAYNRVDGKRKGWVKPGTKVNVTIYSDSWCLTNKGYIRTEYLDIEHGD